MTNKYDKSTLQLLEYLGEGFQLLDHDFRYLHLNDTAVKHSKFQRREDLVGFTMMEKYPGIEKTAFFKALKDCIENKSRHSMENEFYFPDGSKGYFELKIQGVPEGVVILSSDITDRKLSQMEKDERIDVLEEMMFHTSHKVRQPVSHIMGVSYLLDQKIVSGDDLQRVTRYLKNSLADLDNFTRELTQTMHDLKTKVRNRA